MIVIMLVEKKKARWVLILLTDGMFQANAWRRFMTTLMATPAYRPTFPLTGTSLRDSCLLFSMHFDGWEGDWAEIEAAKGSFGDVVKRRVN